jgi:type II secretory pathway pseudopilin PulG
MLIKKYLTNIVMYKKLHNFTTSQLHNFTTSQLAINTLTCHPALVAGSGIFKNIRARFLNVLYVGYRNKSGMKNGGVTLVELAIVIVIIGLLVGGVMQGQELIEAGKQRKLISEINELNIALQTYKLKYNAIPGDHINATTFFSSCGSYTVTTCNGDGDGYLRETWPQEVDAFFVHLHLANILPLKSMAQFANNSRQLASFPKSEFLATGGLYSYGTSTSPITAPNKNMFFLYRNYYMISGQGSAINPEQAFGLDTKIDDGNPLLGKVIAGTGPYDSQGTECLTGTLATASSSSYLLSNPIVSCRIYIDM